MESVVGWNTGVGVERSLGSPLGPKGTSIVGCPGSSVLVTNSRLKLLKVFVETSIVLFIYYELLEVALAIQLTVNKVVCQALICLFKVFYLVFGWSCHLPEVLFGST